ncbi:MAG: restriction endonuclease subunit S [Bacteroidetes bacterium]|nr:restriction endonuclease subunit S [Bacteroidota bacterium]
MQSFEGIMPITLENIAVLTTGLYLKTDAVADTYYLQGIHFNEFGMFDQTVRPQVKSSPKTEKHLLHHGDVLFAAKGLYNYAVVFDEDEIAVPAVASSTFIVIRLKRENMEGIDPHYLAWYLGHTPDVLMLHKQLGTTVPSISISNLSKLPVAIPPMERQQQIVSVQELRNKEKSLSRTLEEKKDQYLKYQLLRAATR